MLVSVIVPTFNRPYFLKEALWSLSHQTHQCLEILVVNDAGVDVREHLTDPRIRYFQHPTNRGLSAARNTALKEARGSYICYLDDDDYFYPNHIGSLVTALEKSPNAIAYTDLKVVLKEEVDGKIYSYTHRIRNTESTPVSLLIDNYLPPAALMHKKECLDAVGLFDESLKRHEDWDLWIRLSRKFSFLHIPEVTAEYTFIDGNHQQMGKQWRGHFLNSMQKIHLRYREFAAPNIQIVQEFRRDWLFQRTKDELESNQFDINELAPIVREIEEVSLQLTPNDRQRAKTLLKCLEKMACI